MRLGIFTASLFKPCMALISLTLTVSSSYPRFLSSNYSVWFSLYICIYIYVWVYTWACLRWLDISLSLTGYLSLYNRTSLKLIKGVCVGM